MHFITKLKFVLKIKNIKNYGTLSVQTKNADYFFK